MAGESEFFTKLVRSVQLPAAAVADASGKHERVRRVLNRRYYDLESGTLNSSVAGSYGKDTEIRPPSDVDILFELPDGVYYRFLGRSGNIQSQLLQEVKGVLVAAFPTTHIRADGQIVSVPFSTYAVEVLPAFRTSDGKYRHADANSGGSWRTTDPREEMAALRRSNAATGGKTIHLIKLAKAWKANRNVKIKSLVLELAAVQFLAQWGSNRLSDGSLSSYAFYDWMMRDFFAWLQRQTNTYWLVPGTYDTIATGDEWAAQARFAASAAATACEDHAKGSEWGAAYEWRKIFGDYVE